MVMGDKPASKTGALRNKLEVFSRCSCMFVVFLHARWLRAVDQIPFLRPRLAETPWHRLTKEQ